MILPVAIILFAGLVFVRPCTGQSLVTDRPDFTESAVTIPNGLVQLESGLTYTSSGHGFEEVTIGELLVRWGVGTRLEFRFGAPNFISTSNDNTNSGLGDGNIGAKIQLGPLASDWDLAVIASSSVPVGEDAFSTGEFDPSIIVTTGRALSEVTGLGAQVMAGLPSDGTDRSLEWGATLVVGSSLNNSTGLFIELAVTVPETGTAPLIGHVGITHRFNDRLQIDMHSGIGLSESAPDVLVGFGLAKLFP